MANESQYKRYRDNWGKVFSSSDQANSPINSASGSNNQTTNESSAGTDRAATGPQPKIGNKPTAKPHKKCKPPNPWLEFSIQIALCVFTLGAFVAAAIYAYVASGQLDTMNKTYMEAEKQTKAARDSMVTSQKAFVFFSMAINGIADTNQDGRITAWRMSVPIQNSGNTPTKNLSIAGRVFLNGVLGKAPIPYSDGAGLDDRPALFLPPHLPGNETIPATVGAIRITQIRTRPIYFYGWAKYSDVFDVTDKTPVHVTMYCFQMNSYTGDPQVPASNFHPTFAPCLGRHNCADDECDGEPYGNGQVWHATKHP
jgi:hypothetical protein